MKNRKTNRAKQVSPSCKNHGSCPWCYGNRTHSNRKRQPIVTEEDYMRTYVVTYWVAGVIYEEEVEGVTIPDARNVFLCKRPETQVLKVVPKEYSDD